MTDIQKRDILDLIRSQKINLRDLFIVFQFDGRDNRYLPRRVEYADFLKDVSNNIDFDLLNQNAGKQDIILQNRAPTINDGRNGDFFINQANYEMSHKENNAWTSLGTLIGGSSISKTFLTTDVVTTLNKADTALQRIGTNYITHEMLKEDIIDEDNLTQAVLDKLNAKPLSGVGYVAGLSLQNNKNTLRVSNPDGTTTDLDFRTVVKSITYDSSTHNFTITPTTGSATTVGFTSLGWTPVFAMESSGANAYLRITDWTGGTGTKPATGYLGSTGIVSNSSNAINFKGTQGLPGLPGLPGIPGMIGQAGSDADYFDVQGFESVLDNKDENEFFILDFDKKTTGNNPEVYLDGSTLTNQGTNSSFTITPSTGVSADAETNLLGLESIALGLHGNIKFNKGSSFFRAPTRDSNNNITATFDDYYVLISEFASYDSSGSKEYILGIDNAFHLYTEMGALKYEINNTVVDLNLNYDYLKKSKFALSLSKQTTNKNIGTFEVKLSIVYREGEGSDQRLIKILEDHVLTITTATGLYVGTLDSAQFSFEAVKNLTVDKTKYPVSVSTLLKYAETTERTSYYHKDQYKKGSISFKEIKRTIGQISNQVFSNTSGWSPVLSIITSEQNRFLQITDWVGGTGTKPETGQYLTASGLSFNSSDAVNIRGATGSQGSPDTGAQIVTKLSALTGNNRLPASAVRDIVTNSFDNVSLSGNILTFERSDDSTSLDVDLSSISGAGSETSFTSVSLNGNTLTLTRRNNTSASIVLPSGDGVSNISQVVTALEGLTGDAKLNYDALRNTPTIPVLRTGAETVTLLSSLTGNARLPASAVRGLPTSFTNVSFSGTNLTFTKSDGTTQVINLNSLDEGNPITNVSFSGTNLTFTKLDNTTQVINLSSLDEGNPITGVSVSGTNLIFTRLTGTNLSVSLPEAVSDTGAQIVTKLSALTGNNRLPASAVRGLPNTFKNASFSGNNLTFTKVDDTTQVINLSSLDEGNPITGVSISNNVISFSRASGSNLTITLPSTTPTGAQIVTALEGLTGNNRLQSSAIRGLPVSFTAVSFASQSLTFTKSDGTTQVISLASVLNIDPYTNASISSNVITLTKNSGSTTSLTLPSAQITDTDLGSASNESSTVAPSRRAVASAIESAGSDDTVLDGALLISGDNAYLQIS